MVSMSRSDQLFVEEEGELGAMLEWQGKLTALLFQYSQPAIEQGSDGHVKETLGCLAVEAAEAFAPFLTSTKPWKPTAPDMEHVDEEVIDCLHFMLTYFNLRGLNPSQIVALYRKKNLRNGDRLWEKLHQLNQDKERQNGYVSEDREVVLP